MTWTSSEWGAQIAEADVSLLRLGDDLFVELERDDGFLIDTVTVTDHFLGRETGLEVITFETGATWDRAEIEARLRDGRFNAQNDIFRFGIEDEVAIIDPAQLIENDATAGTDELELVSVQAPTQGSVSINDEGMIEFLGAQDHFGDAFFAYTVRDPLGRESTARVEVNLSPVNDAPVANDDPLQYGIEDVPLRIRIENLLANDFDVDGDAEQEGLRIVRIEPLTNGAGEPLRPYEDRKNYDGPATDATWKIGGQYIELAPRPDHFGFAGFRYVLADNDGAESKADVEIYFAPVNDAPRIREGAVSAKLGETTTFSVNQLMSKVYDIERDGFSFVGLNIGADGNASTNGSEVFDAALGLIHYTPEELGKAHIAFDVIDDRGAEATLDFNIEVRPLNLPPDARDDSGFRLLQDGTILIDPEDLLRNDRDPDDDPLIFDSVYRFAENGKVRVTEDGMISFAARPDYNGAASFEYTVSDGRGGFDSAQVNLTILPVNNGPELRGDVVARLEDGPLDVIAAEAFGNDLDLDGDVLFFAETTLLGQLEKRFLSPDYSVRATAPNNANLPDWLDFDDRSATFTGVVPEDFDGAVEVAVFLEDPGSGAVHPFRFTWESNAAFDELATGISVEETLLEGFTLRESFRWTLAPNEDDVARFDISGGTFTAQVNGGRPLPAWLAFDAESRSLALSDFGTDENDTPARVQIVYTPGARPDLPENTFYATDRGFTLEFVVDPADPQLAALNAVLAGDPALEALGQFGLDLSSETGLQVTRESGAPLNSWLTFDADTLTFDGLPPSEYVGAVPVRLDVSGDGALPAMSLITEAVVDETFTVIDAGRTSPFAVADLPERITVSAPEDFNGALAFTYEAEDEKGGESDAPANIVFNIRPTREAAEANEDRFELFENGFITFALSDLLVNDRDDDGDPLRITDFTAPVSGQFEISLGQVEIAAPATITPLPGGTWSAALESGEALPGWMELNVATGAITARVPLDVTDDYTIRFTNALGEITRSDTVTRSFDGNAGALVTYTATPGFAGEDSLTYTLTDDAEGLVSGTVIFDVASLLDPPIAATDGFVTFEDGSLVVTSEMLLANDSDVDGDPVRFLGLGTDVTNGTVTLDGEEITFTPTPDFAGLATFTYRVTDDRHGESEGRVEVTVRSTNQSPEAVTDVFNTVEDTPFEFTIVDLLANDTDPDGDTLSFLSLADEVRDGRILELPDNRYQFVPDENVTGPVSFSYRISDGRLKDVGTVTFDIAEVNDAPIANPDGFFLGDQDSPIVVDFADLLANDRDVEGDAFSIVEIFDGDNGTVIQEGDTAVFTGRLGYFGDGGFSYRVTDEFGATSVGYAQVLVLPQFDVPVAVSDAGFEMLEDSTLDLDPDALMSNDQIPLGSEVTFLGLTVAPMSAGDATVAELENGLWRITPDENFFGELVLRYALTNETGFEVPTTVTIDVLGTSDAPVAVDDSFTMAEDVPDAIFVSTLLANDSDPDRQGFALSRILGTQGIDATLTEDGQVLLAPPPGASGAAWFDYEIVDSSGITDRARVNITIEALNDAPIITDPGPLLAVEDLAVDIALPAGTIRDPDGDALVVELRGAGGTALPAWLDFDAETRKLSGQPPENENGDIDLELFVSDGREEVLQPLVLRLSATNDAPRLITPQDDLTATEDTGFTLSVAQAVFADIDGDPLVHALTLADGSALPAWLAFDPDTRALSGTPPQDFNGEIALLLRAGDGLLYAEDRFNLTVAAVNDAPVMTASGGAANVAFSYAGDLSAVLFTASASDVDGDEIRYALDGADSGRFEIDALSGALGYVAGGTFPVPPSADGDAVFQVTVTASDPSGASATQALDITLGMNQSPSARDDRASTLQDTDTRIAVLANDSDPENDPLSIGAITEAASGSVAIEGAELVYTPDAGFWGVDRFSYTVEDGNGGSASAEVVIEVNRVNARLDGTGDENLNPWQSITKVVSPSGDLLSRTTLFDDGTARAINYSYDENSALLRKDVSREDGNTSTTIYGADGVADSFVFNDLNDTRSWDSRRFTYDDDGNVLQQVTVMDDGNGTRTIDNSYNESGALQQRVVTRPDEDVLTYSFGPDGVIDTIVVQDNRDTRSWATQTNTYDGNGNAIRRVFQSEEGDVIRTVLLDYDDNDGLREKVVSRANGDIATTLYGEDGMRDSYRLEDISDTREWESRLTTYDAAGAVVDTTFVWDLT